MIIGRMINMKSDPKNGRSMLRVPPSAEITAERVKAGSAHKKLPNCQHSSPCRELGPSSG